MSNYSFTHPYIVPIYNFLLWNIKQYILRNVSVLFFIIQWKSVGSNVFWFKHLQSVFFGEHILLKSLDRIFKEIYFQIYLTW